MSGHGHVFPNADGTKARCGGPGICPQCSQEYARKHMRENSIPRRADLQRNTLAEMAIRNAVGEVEKLGAHPALTDVVSMLGHARERLADYLDDK